MRPGVLALLVAIALLYGSLIPFDFTVGSGGASSADWLRALTTPRWVDAPGHSSLGVPYAVSDTALNVLLYLPLGMTLRMALRRRGDARVLQVGAAVLAGLVLSWTIESLQGLMPARVASLNDVVANSVGALLGALAATLLWGWYKRLAFACFCRLAGVIDRLRAWRDRPVLVILLALFNAGVIGLWYASELGRAGIVDSRGGALPFEQAFELPYDLGALVLGQALLAYAGIGCLLMLLTYTGARRLAMNWVVLGVVSIAFAAELSRAATNDAVPDITGPLLALAAGALMSVTVYTFSHAVRRANRRRHEQDYDGPDRRRRPHEYAEA